MDQNVTISSSVGAAIGKFGVITDTNLLHADETSVSPVYAEGANVSIDISPKNSLSFNVVNAVSFNMLRGNSTPSDFKLSASVEGGDVLHAGASFSLDLNGNLSILPKAGLGFGEMASGKIGKSDVSYLVGGQVNLPHKQVDEDTGDE